MWLCPYCEAANDDADKKCIVCDYRISASPAVLQYCIYCGVRYMAGDDDHYCMNCGGLLPDGV